MYILIIRYRDGGGTNDARFSALGCDPVAGSSAAFASNREAGQGFADANIRKVE